MWNVSIARRQVRAFERCRHPGVVRFVDVGTSGGMHYLSGRMSRGKRSTSSSARETKLSAGLAAHYLLQTAEGLEDCHRQGLFHGLLKPSDLMLSPEQQVRILDSASAPSWPQTDGESLVDTMSTANALTSGLDCVSPESIVDPSNRNPAGDQYSLGCILYFCLTGRYPFADGSALEKITAHQLKQPPPIRDFSPEVPEQLVAVVTRLLQKTPEARFGSMAEVIEALRPLAEAPSAARADTRPSALDDESDAGAILAEECPEAEFELRAVDDGETVDQLSHDGRCQSTALKGQRRPPRFLGFIACLSLLGILASLAWAAFHQ